jgi:tRNA G18 (ribose-2'-O)-methylase SpoU
VTIVVERATNDHNYLAILRTVKALGIQHVWIIDPPPISLDVDNQISVPHLSQMKVFIKETDEERKTRINHYLFAQKAMEWLMVREFHSTKDCLDTLRVTGHKIWVTDLLQQAVRLTYADLPLSKEFNSVIPNKLAVVFGTEAVGYTQEMLEVADPCVYLPLRGFAHSLNLSVAASLVVHQLFVLDPSIEGAMLEDKR